MGGNRATGATFELTWVRSPWPSRLAFWLGTAIWMVIPNDAVDTGYSGEHWVISSVRGDVRRTVFRSKERYAAETRLKSLQRSAT